MQNGFTELRDISLLFGLLREILTTVLYIDF